jgi:hypothetical protein
MRGLMKSISRLEEIAKERLKENTTAEFEHLTLLTQLSRYGVCACQCHFSASFYHSQAPCCGNAKAAAGLD